MASNTSKTIQTKTQADRPGMNTPLRIGLGCAFTVFLVVGLVVWGVNSILHAPRQAWSVAWSGDGKMLAAGFGWWTGPFLGRDQADQTVRVWNTDHLDQKPIVLKRHESPVIAVAFSPDGRYLASGENLGGAGVLLWDAHNLNAPLVNLGGVGNRALAFSPNGRWLAGVGGFWDMQNLSAPPITLFGANEQLLTPVTYTVSSLT